MQKAIAWVVGIIVAIAVSFLLVWPFAIIGVRVENSLCTAIGFFVIAGMAGTAAGKVVYLRDWNAVFSAKSKREYLAGIVFAGIEIPIGILIQFLVGGGGQVAGTIEAVATILGLVVRACLSDRVARKHGAYEDE